MSSPLRYHASEQNLTSFPDIPPSQNKLWLVSAGFIVSEELYSRPTPELDDGLLAWYGLSHALVSFRNRIKFARSLNFGIAVACIINLAAVVLGITMPSTIAVGTTDGILPTSITASTMPGNLIDIGIFNRTTDPFRDPMSQALLTSIIAAGYIYDNTNATFRLPRGWNGT